ncbi:PP2C family protein-serine/threonine phosphatase [Candidatus Contubernalis alkaliaceticus]|uniref:PP2C family protein-serine/threonine phosphatase n=1 Tax=Candidatus Contubernalis alkaliaceticus TaxID=338645 RepID=UPI001F4C06A4|nr:protein phosphatase 2C domain-containing protein [Candidatus Contubernalis alkalaceticus]UNC91458.1 serine/threonine-protein phosphatase [Candidatus Contubernalis alkalaceticus]
MKFQTAFISKTGGRKVNEDYCSFMESEGFGCYFLADGLGGHKGGALAASIAGEKLLEAFAAAPGFSGAHLVNYLENARQAFIAEKKRQGKFSMKTTLVVLLSDFKKVFWAHIGDSRLYYFQSGRLAFQTKDHSVPQRLASSGEISAEKIRYHEDRNRLTRAFDGDDLSRIDFLKRPVDVSNGDSFLLCSDGFWEYVLEPEMEEDLLVSRSPEAWLSSMEKRLSKRAKANHDNYSALAVMVESF